MKKLYNFTKRLNIFNDLGFTIGNITEPQVHNLGILHKSAHLFLLDKDDNLLLQKKSSSSDHYPGMYTVYPNCHVYTGEVGNISLKKELGLNHSKIKYDFLFSYRKDAKLGDYIDKQFNDVYVGRTNVDLKDINYDKSEVEKLEFVPFSEFRSMVKFHKSIISPMYDDKMLKDLLFFTSDNKVTSDIDVLSESGLRTGQIMNRGEIHTIGLPHRAVHLYLFNNKGDILLQKRAENLDHYSSMYSISLTGHIDSGEGSSKALKRELKEELGLNHYEIKYSFLFSYRKDAKLGDYIDKQFNDVYVGRTNVDLKDINYDKSEVEKLEFVPFSEFRSMVESSKPVIAPVYGDALNEILQIQDEGILKELLGLDDSNIDGTF